MHTTSTAKLAALLAALGLWSCDSGGDPPIDGGLDGGLDADADFMGDPCLGRGRFIFLLDIERRLLRLSPETFDIELVGPLDCVPGGTPISMSIDREGQAWVLYDDHRLYQASTSDGSCAPTAFTPDQEGFEVFGMGFVSATAGSDEEALYVSGGRYADFVPGGTARLGRLDPSSLTLTPLGEVPGWPELTGTGAGELWAFFPGTQPASVRQLDRGSAAALRTIELPALDLSDTINWAFAFWGGELYLFLQERTDPSTSVWRLDPETAELIEAVPDSGYSIVGAGVSTCAPLDVF